MKNYFVKIDNSIFYNDVDKKISIKVVGSDFTKLPPYFLFNQLSTIDKPSILSQKELLEATTNLEATINIKDSPDYQS